MTDPADGFSFRQLYHLLMDDEGDRPMETLVRPSLPAARAALAGLAAFRTFDAPSLSADALQAGLWDLYALGRLNDVLILPFQADHRGACDWPPFTLDHYLEFADALGLVPFTSGEFAPFRHEIARVEPAQDPSEPIRVTATLWPGLMFGELMIARSGVSVSGGANVVNGRVAEHSTLYFTHRRLHRPTNDLSRGWGGNSQWRTDFRRDYEHRGRWLYHVDGKHQLGVAPPTEPDRDGLTPDERIELCRNRGFILTEKPDDDLWPYDDRFDEPATS